MMKATGWTNLQGRPQPGIRFNNRAFTEPAPLAVAEPPVASGIYVVLAPDPLGRPRPFRAIYFGESANFQKRITQSHEHLAAWIAEAGGVANVYVAFCPTPLLSAAQRRWAESDLISRYQPACNLKNHRLMPSGLSATQAQGNNPSPAAICTRDQ